MSGKSDRTKITENAQRLVKAGRLAEAASEYEKLLEGTAQDIPIRNILGDLHLRLGHEERAVKIFRSNIASLETQGSYSQALALCKRIIKLVPRDSETVIKMGDLYSTLGFMAEAKEQYDLAAEIGGPAGSSKVLVALYEKMIGLDRADLETRLKLARLLVKIGSIDRATAELNETAELLLAKGEAGEAGRLLREAHKIKDSDARTLGNLARAMERERRVEDAIALVEDSVARHGPRPELLSLLGDLLLNAHKDARAGEIFDRILAEDADNADARTKRGVLLLRAGQPNEAFALYEPLIVSLLSHSRDEQVVGLLGLILFAQPSHRPSLDQLASIFRRIGRPDALSVVLRTLLAEVRRQGDADAVRASVAELVEICPDDPEIRTQWKALQGPEPKEEGEATPSRAAVLPQPDQDIIRTNLAKSDLYLDQGLIRNARRVLENLMLLYPDDPRIAEQFERLPKDAPVTAPVDVSSLIERLIGQDAPPEAKPAAPHADVSSLIDRIIEWDAPPEAKPAAPHADVSSLIDRVIDRDAPPEAKPAAPPERSMPERIVSDTVSLDEIFGGTDLSASRPASPADILYPDLREKIREELDAIETAFYRQIKEKTAVIEKDLGEIVAEFKRQVEDKIERTNFEARYNLGLAFLEQGLYDEAVAEFQLAAKEAARAADCFALIAQCWKRRRHSREALRWIDEAQRLVTAGSDADFALTYERAELLEDLNENAEALGHFRRVKTWNAKYRDVSIRVKILEKIA